jgi:hypothetical protein
MSDDLIDPRAILAKLEEVRAETLKRLNSLTQEELDWRPGTKRTDTGADEWSLGEVFMHIAIDEHHLRENIARPLLEGVKPPESIEFLPPPPPYQLPKEAILYWFERTRILTRRLLENWPFNANLELRHHGGFEEAMNGAEWLLGYGGHEAFHHRQIDALIDQYQRRV